MTLAYHNLCISLISVHTVWVVPNVQCYRQPTGQASGESVNKIKTSNKTKYYIFNKIYIKLVF